MYSVGIDNMRADIIGIAVRHICPDPMKLTLSAHSPAILQLHLPKYHTTQCISVYRAGNLLSVSVASFPWEKCTWLLPVVYIIQSERVFVDKKSFTREYIFILSKKNFV